MFTIVEGFASCGPRGHDWIKMTSKLERTRAQCSVFECQNLGCESVKVEVL